MKPFLLPIATVLLCAVPALSSVDCDSLQFEDDLMGVLKPCDWDNARGMLCMESSPEVIVFPNAEQSEVLTQCGITIKTRRRRSAIDAEFFFEESSRRQKRSFSPFRNSAFKFQKILKGFVQKEWGKATKEDIDEMARVWLESKLQLSNSKEKGEFRAFLSETKHLRSSGNIIKHLRESLNIQKRDKNLDFLNVELILNELNSCTFSRYSGSTNQDVKFDAPDKETGRNSSVALWYYRVGCMQKDGRVFANVVIYSDRLTFGDVEKTVEYLRNNPETFARIIIDAKKRKEIGKVESVKGNYHSTCGSSVFCVTKTTHEKIATMEEFELVDYIPRLIRENRDHWVKDTKNIFVKQTLTLGQKRDLEKWMRESMLSEVFEKFSNFLD